MTTGETNAMSGADAKTSTKTPVEWGLLLLAHLWLAEYLEAGAWDLRLNRDLFGVLTGRITLGKWVALARRFREVFLSGKRETVVEGLAAAEFGEPGDGAHSVARLVEFRNSVAHGGLQATEDDERVHAELLAGLLSQVRGLDTQPILFRTEDGRLLRADARLPGVGVGASPVPNVPTEVPPEPSLQPFIVGRDPRRVLHLYPILKVVAEGETHRLVVAETETRKQPVPALFEREVLRDWYARYVREKQGNVEFGEALAGRVRRAVPESLVAEVVDALRADGVSLVVVEAHPACGKTGVLATLPDLARRGSFAASGLWLIEPGDIGASGLTFVNFLLRRTEVCLGRQEGTLGMAAQGWRASLKGSMDALRGAGRRILIGIEDLHFGFEAVPGDPVSVAEVFRALAGGPFAVVATIHPGRVPGRLPFDRRVRIPAPVECEIDLDRLAVSIRQLCPKGRPMRRRVLEELARRASPATLFDLCDTLDAQGPPVFEPEVERSLWDLRPLLRVEGTAGGKTWAPFSPALARVVLSGASK